LSPVRILVMILMLPVTTAVIAMSVFIRTSEFEREDAVLHLIALAGCQTVISIAPGLFRVGEPGYHRRNDPDGDGVACGTIAPPTPNSSASPRSDASKPRAVGNAKFIRP